MDIEITFTPQRWVDAALLISVVGVLACVVLALRRPRQVHAVARPAILLPDLRRTDPALALRPSLLALLVAAIASLLLLPVPYAMGAVLFTALSCRGPRWLSLAGPAAVGAAAAWVVLLQARDRIIPGYEWALETARPHSLTMLGVSMVVISTLLSSMRHRAGGPSLPEDRSS
jgi:hypothetical protein